MNKKQLAYICAATMGMMSQGLEPYIPHHKKPETKYDKKKCKSCKYFQKNIPLCDCTNSGGKSHTQPMDIACAYYQKRKK